MISAPLLAMLFSCTSPAGRPVAKADSPARRLDLAAPIGSAIKRADSVTAPDWVKAPDTPVYFAGLWVNEVYIQRVRTGMPLRRAQGVMMSCIEIPLRTLKVTRMVGGFHDGAADMVLRKNGSGYCFYYTYNYIPGDTVIPLADGRLKIGKNYFQHLDDDKLSSDDGILEQLLFAGRYRRTDTDTAGSIIFEENGHIQGFDSFRYYSPTIDYADMNAAFDHIRIGSDARHLQDYGFRFIGDTLMIYDRNRLRYNGEYCDSEALGELLYVLPKIKIALGSRTD
jgi:hypothetical protein